MSFNNTNNSELMKLFEVDMHKIFRHFGDQKLVYKVFNCYVYVFVIGLHLYKKLSIIIFLCFENIKFCFEYWFLLYFLTYFLSFYENENHCLISLFLNELANFITKQPVCSWRQILELYKNCSCTMTIALKRDMTSL